MNARKALRTFGIGFGGLLLVAGLALVVFLNVVGPDACFVFLSGHPAVESIVAGHASEGSSEQGEFRAYAWKEPMTIVFSRANRELRVKGYRLVVHKADFASWKRGRWSVVMDDAQIGKRPYALFAKRDPSSTMVLVQHELDYDAMFQFRLLFSPYGILQS